MQYQNLKTEIALAQKAPKGRILQKNFKNMLISSPVFHTNTTLNLHDILKIGTKSEKYFK